MGWIHHVELDQILFRHLITIFLDHKGHLLRRLLKYFVLRHIQPKDKKVNQSLKFILSKCGSRYKAWKIEDHFFAKSPTFDWTWICNPAVYQSFVYHFVSCSIFYICNMINRDSLDGRNVDWVLQELGVRLHR
jgi:hypothetical protein